MPNSPSATRPSHPPAVLLTIAGFDPGSGAGITADIATFAAHGFFGTSAITALTVQSTRGVCSVHSVDAPLLQQTLDTLTADLSPAGIKIGMLGSAQVVEAVAQSLARLRSAAGNPRALCVLDPILKASSGATLLEPQALTSMHQTLFPLVDWITPNWAELAALTAQPPITSTQQALSAMESLAIRHPHLNIVATGGDNEQPTDLLRLATGQTQTFPGEHIASKATHGTGCAFSSSLLCHLVAGADPLVAVAAAKHFVTQAILRAPGLGHGKGPMDLLWPLKPVHATEPA